MLMWKPVDILNAKKTWVVVSERMKDEYVVKGRQHEIFEYANWT